MVDADVVVNVATVPHRSPFRYPGGKTWFVPYIRQWLRSLPKKPAELAEPFAGGAIVGLSALFDELVERLTIIELDERVAAVWRVVVGGAAQELANRITSFRMKEKTVRTLLSREMDDDNPLFPAQDPSELIDRAFVAILRNRVQRGGIMAPGATLMKKGENGKGIASRWYAETISKRIMSIDERRENISFIQGDGIEFIKENAHRKGLVFFIDPPYTIAGRRLYVHSDIDHEELFRVTAKVKGDFLMTYDNAEPIRKLAKQFGFAAREVAMKNTHHTVMEELLIGRNLDWIPKRARR